MPGCGSMRVVINRSRGSCDSYIKVYEIGGEEFRKGLEEISPGDEELMELTERYLEEICLIDWVLGCWIG
jgi:GGDEF domain-containing protein